jgi:repressor LexA
MSASLSNRQQQVLEYIQSFQLNHGFSPSHREIAAHFGFSSPNAAMDHIKALRAKGALAASGRRARALRVLSAPAKRQSRRINADNIISIPILGSIAAGLPTDESQENEGCVLVDVNAIGIRPTARTFGLKVRGDSMIGKHVVDGDLAIIEHGVEPRSGDIVAALIDGQVTLKTFLMQRGRPYLKAENPRYPNLIPQEELQVQGVMVGLVRKRKA